MSQEKQWLIEPLTKRHDRSSFDCDEPALNDFLRKHARQQQDKHFNRTFVAIAENDSVKSVVGYHTLSAGSIAFASLPDDISKELPRYPVPVARLGRLAVDKRTKGQGLGQALLRHAILRAANIAQSEMGIAAFVVDAKNDAAVAFYQHFGFIRFDDEPNSLLILMTTILKALK